MPPLLPGKFSSPSMEVSHPPRLDARANHRKARIKSCVWRRETSFAYPPSALPDGTPPVKVMLDPPPAYHDHAPAALPYDEEWMLKHNSRRMGDQRHLAGGRCFHLDLELREGQPGDAQKG